MEQRERETYLRFVEDEYGALIRAGGTRGRAAYREAEQRFIGHQYPDLTHEFQERYFMALPNDDREIIVGPMLTVALDKEATRLEVGHAVFDVEYRKNQQTCPRDTIVFTLVVAVSLFLIGYGLYSLLAERF